MLSPHLAGVVEEATLQWVKVNGVEAELYGDYWVAIGVPLNTEGNNDILVEARDAVGRSGYGSVSVTRDTQDPEVEITSPENNEKVHTRFIMVSGTVSDATLYDVKVNGIPATIDGETFTAADVPLDTEGENTVTAVARDGVGHESESSITVVRSLPPVLAITSIVFSEQSSPSRPRTPTASRRAWTRWLTSTP